MPTFDSYPTSHLVKPLYIGDSGSGKTGSLCSLGAAGYNVRILDLDNGVELIKDFVTNPGSMYRSAKPGHWTKEQCQGIEQRMSYVTITEDFQIAGGKTLPKGTAWNKINNQLQKWVDGQDDYGNVGDWGPNDVLVIDTLTKFARAAWNFQLSMNQRLGGRPEKNDYWQAQILVENVLTLLQSPAVKCNVIIIGHIDYVEKGDGLTRGVPETIGEALSLKLGRNFNHTLLAKTSGQGTSAVRKIITNTTGMIDLKNTAPLRVKAEYELSTGLCDYFRDVRGEAPPK